MGQRARKKGITNAAVRAARRAVEERDDECAAIAQRVYHVAHELKTDGEPEPLPLDILAPLMMAAENVAPAACRIAKLPVTEAMAHEVAAYLVAGFREMALMLDPKHLREWQEKVEEAAKESDEEAATPPVESG